MGLCCGILAYLQKYDIMKIISLIALLLLNTTPVFSQILTINNHSSSIPIGNYLYYYSSQQAISADSIILLQDQFKPLRKSSHLLNFGYNLAYNWVKFDFIYDSIGNPNKDFYLFIDKATVQQIEFILLEDNQIIQQSNQGIDFPYVAEFYKMCAFHFKISPKPHKKYTVFVCLHNHMDSLNAAMYLKTGSELDNFNNNYIFSLNIAFVITFLTLFISIWNFRKINIYITYLIYLACIICNIISHEGIWYKLIGLDFPPFLMLSKMLFIALGLPFFIFFNYQITSVLLSERWRKVFFCFVLVASLCFISYIVFYTYAIYSWNIELGKNILSIYNFSLMLVCGICLMTSLHYLLRSEERIKAILLSTGNFLVAFMGVIVMLNNLLGSSAIPAINRYAYAICFVIDVVCFLGVVLYEKNRIEKMEKLALSTHNASLTQENILLNQKQAELAEDFRKKMEEITSILEELEKEKDGNSFNQERINELMTNLKQAKEEKEKIEKEKEKIEEELNQLLQKTKAITYSAEECVEIYNFLVSFLQTPITIDKKTKPRCTFSEANQKEMAVKTVLENFPNQYSATNIERHLIKQAIESIHKDEIGNRNYYTYLLNKLQIEYIQGEMPTIKQKDNLLNIKALAITSGFKNQTDFAELFEQYAGQSIANYWDKLNN